MNARLDFPNSRVVLEYGEAGVIGRVVFDSGRTEYAGPLPPETLDSLFEVAEVNR